MGAIRVSWCCGTIGIGSAWFAAIAITAVAAEARKHRDPVKRRFQRQFSGLREAGLLRPLVPIAAFELGNMATTLLILRGTGLLHTHGRSVAAATSLAVLVYAGHNLFASIVAYVGGHWIDRSGPRLAFATTNRRPSPAGRCGSYGAG